MSMLLGKVQRCFACGAALIVTGCIAAAPAHPQNGPPVGIPVKAPNESAAIPLYGDATPGSTNTENWAEYGRADRRAVKNVTRPTLTPFLPDPSKATGASVIVAPGGAFMLLAMDTEGWQVAQALADRGIAAFVLKYRVMPTPRDEQEAGRFMMDKMTEGLGDPTQMPSLRYPPATEDALAAIALVRARAAEWRIDPDRVGVIGFSAGAMTALNTVIDAKPKQGPAFLGYIYGPQARIDVPPDAPPMFNAIALDDELFPNMGFPIVQAWRAAGRLVELHAYERGFHGFGGLGLAGTTTTLVLDQFVAWMSMHGLLESKTKK